MADVDLVSKLTALRSIDFSALDYDTIQRELLEYLRIAASNNGLVDDFSSGDAAKMYIDLISYLGDVLAFRIDTLSNENYLSTAQRRKSIINILDLVGQRPNNPTTASVTVNMVPSTITPVPILVPLRYSFTTVGTDGSNVTFEIMSGPTDYFRSVQIPAGVSNYNLSAYSGSYQTVNVTSTGQPSMEFILPSYPVVEDSVMVSVSPVSSSLLTSSIIESRRIREVESLIQPDEEMFYSLRYDENGKAILTFPTDSFGKIPPVGHTIHVDYRVGGGLNTNISAGTINVNASFATTAGNFVNVAITNPTTFGVGGNDLQDLEDVRISAPALVRANNNLVTTDDYEAILGDISGIQDVFAVDAYNDNTLYFEAFGVTDNSVFIWVLPTTGGEISPDLRQQIYTELETRRLTAIQNFVFNPSYNDWELTASVNVLDGFDINEVRQNITDALLTAYGREVATFKNKVRRSRVISTIQSVSGVDYVNIITPAADIDADENEVLRLLETNIVLSMTQV